MDGKMKIVLLMRCHRKKPCQDDNCSIGGEMIDSLFGWKNVILVTIRLIS
jgi:hypothetical protein